MPGGNDVITPESSILFIGTFEQIKSLNAAAETTALGLSLKDGPINLRNFVLSQNEAEGLNSCTQQLRLMQLLLF
jgi:hypothetical protein